MAAETIFAIEKKASWHCPLFFSEMASPNVGDDPMVPILNDVVAMCKEVMEQRKQRLIASQVNIFNFAFNNFEKKHEKLMCCDFEQLPREFFFSATKPTDANANANFLHAGNTTHNTIQGL